MAVSTIREWTAFATNVPGDGKCLFHAIGYAYGFSGGDLKRAVMDFIIKFPDSNLHDVSLRNWILWDSSLTPEKYVERMKRGQWGGSLETGILSSMLKTPIFIYQPKGNLCKRVNEARPDLSISSIELNRQLPYICILWTGKSHYMFLDARF